MNSESLLMPMKNLSCNKSFGGWNKQYSHHAESLNGSMRFAIFLPPKASNGQ
jgi:S-formylglutathione hydrolase